MAQAPIFVYGSTFDGNSAKIAGAIYASAPIQIYNSVFTGNESTEEAGGALFSKNTLFITSSTFGEAGKGNISAANGGAILYFGSQRHKSVDN